MPDFEVLCNLYNSVRSKKASFANQSLNRAISRALAVSRSLPAQAIPRPISRRHPTLKFIPPTLKTGVPFMMTVLPIQRKKGAAVRPLNCRVKIPLNQPNTEKTHLYPYLLSAWTPFSNREKTRSSVCQKEQFAGLFEIHSCLHKIVPWEYIPRLSEKERTIFRGKFLCIVQVFYWFSLPSLKKFYFGLIAASLIENVRFCPASA